MHQPCKTLGYQLFNDDLQDYFVKQKNLNA